MLPQSAAPWWGEIDLLQNSQTIITSDTAGRSGLLLLAVHTQLHAHIFIKNAWRTLELPKTRETAEPQRLGSATEKRNLIDTDEVMESLLSSSAVRQWSKETATQSVRSASVWWCERGSVSTLLHQHCCTELNDRLKGNGYLRGAAAWVGENKVCNQSPLFLCGNSRSGSAGCVH